MFKSIPFFGLFDISSLLICLLIGFFLGTFVFYRLLHRSARYNEFEVFDALVWSLLGGLIGGRVCHLLLNYPRLPLTPLDWRHIHAFPGTSVFFSVLIAAGVFQLALKKRKITDLELLDHWARGTCFMLIIYHIGLFLDGSGGGFITSSPLGLTFPTTSWRVYPAQLWAAAFFTGLYYLLGYFEKNYRTYDWYRGSRSQAKTGFVFFVFALAATLYQWLTLNFQPSRYPFGHLSGDALIYAATLAALGVIIYQYAVRPSRPKAKKKAKNA